MFTRQKKYWNLFASELEKVLVTHHQSLNKPDPKLQLSTSKLQRLQESLLSSKNLPVLSPDEWEKLELDLPLNGEEQTRLRAALMATEIERLLIYRIGPARALQIAEFAVPLIDNALKELLQLNKNDDTRRGPDWEASESREADMTWDSIWESLDSATLALQLSYYVSSNRERLKKLREARTDFLEALDKLNSLERGIKLLPTWADTHEEARKGLDSTIERLADLGEDD